MEEAEEKPEGRLSARDWERAALAALVDGGMAAVTVPRLAQALGVTKGSFYWHFKSVDALLEAALARWEQAFTDGRLEAFAAIAEPRQRLRPWSDETRTDHAAQRLHLAIAAASAHPLVRPVFARVAAKRIDFIARTLEEMGFAPAVARRRAFLMHAAYLGYLQLSQRAPELLGDAEERAMLVDEAFDLLTSAGLAPAEE